MMDVFLQTFQTLDFHQQCVQCGLKPPVAKKLIEEHLHVLDKAGYKVTKVDSRISVDPEDIYGTLVVSARVSNCSEDDALELSIRCALEVGKNTEIPTFFLFRVEHQAWA